MLNKETAKERLLNALAEKEAQSVQDYKAMLEDTDKLNGFILYITGYKGTDRTELKAECGLVKLTGRIAVDRHMRDFLLNNVSMSKADYTAEANRILEDNPRKVAFLAQVLDTYDFAKAIATATKKAK